MRYETSIFLYLVLTFAIQIIISIIILVGMDTCYPYIVDMDKVQFYIHDGSGYEYGAFFSLLGMGCWRNRHFQF
jgi:hypothetical protein